MMQVSRIVFSNLPLKVFSLCLALLMFYVVRSEKRALSHGSVPVTVQVPADRVLLSQPPRRLRVGVLGPASRVQRFRFEDLASVTIALRGDEHGYFRFRSEMIHLPDGFSVASISPAGFDLRYARVVKRHLPVRAALQGQVAGGFRVIRVDTRPARLQVRGPGEVVAELSALTTLPVDLDGARSNVVARVALAELPPRVVTIGRTKVEVFVSIGPLNSEVTLKDLPINVKGPRPRSRVVKPDTVSITIGGPPQTLAELDRSSISVELDLSRAGKGPLRPTVKGIPAGLRLRRMRPQSVTIAARR